MNNDCVTKITDVTVNEIFQDALFFQVLYEITVNMDNSEAVIIVDRFLKLQSVVFMSELMKFFDEKHIELGIWAEKNEFVRRLNEERNNNGIHYSPIGSDRMKNIIEDMGISWESSCYDINLVVKDNNVINLNVEDYGVKPDELWKNILIIAKSASDGALATVSSKITTEVFLEYGKEKIIENSKRLQDFLSGTRYSYSSCVLFSKTKDLTVEDKVFIMYRYRLIYLAYAFLNSLEGMLVQIGTAGTNIYNIEFEMKSYVRKHIAMVCEIIHNDLDKLKSLQTPFYKEVQKDIDAQIGEKSFFPLNRKLRNNLHYSLGTTPLSKKELNVVDKYQPIYIECILKKFQSKMSINISEEVKEATELLRIIAKKKKRDSL